jgi:hypothetical protein
MSVNVSTLIPLLRIKIGDLTPASYRYTDEWLTTALIASIRALWSPKYSVTDLGVVTRQTQGMVFDPTVDDETIVGTIVPRDHYPICVLAAIIILQGNLENSAWNLASWKDAEISFTNLEGGRIRDGNINRLFDELYSFIKPPSKKLAWGLGKPLPGYTYNVFENKTEL